MSGRSRAALAIFAVVLVIGLALGLGVGGRPAPASPGPSGQGSASGSGAPTTSRTPSSSATASAATPSPEVPSGPVVTWSPLSPEGVAPVARQGATWTVDPSTGIAYLYGGTTSATVGRPLKGGATLGDLWSYDLAADTWEPVVGTSDEPPPRSGHVAAWVEDVGLVVVGGRGSDGQALGDAWRFDPAAGWSRLRVTGTAPPIRFDACAAAAGDGTLWLSHGSDGRAALGDTWRLELATGRWTRVARTGGPTTRSGPACWVDAGGRFVLFGGARGDTALGDLWATSVGGGAGAGWTRLAGPGPFPARSLAAAAVHLDEAVVVGGLGSGSDLRDDLGTIGPTDQTISPVPADGPSPAARAGAVLVDDPAGERMLLLGGVTADGVSAELWSADLR